MRSFDVPALMCKASFAAANGGHSSNNNDNNGSEKNHNGNNNNNKNKMGGVDGKKNGNKDISVEDFVQNPDLWDTFDPDAVKSLP